MSIEENKATADRFYNEIFLKGNVDVASEIIAADCVDHNPMPGQAPGLAGIKATFAIIITAFPHEKTEVHHLIAEGDKVVGNWTSTAVNSGPFIGMPPTGKLVTMTGIDILRIADGKIVEMWHQEDVLGILQQIGAIPAGA